MPEITAHPSREQLSAYNLGQLPPDQAVAVESHISECEPCCDTIISLSSDDTFVGLLKEARQLPTDRTVDHAVASDSSSCQDVPVQLAEHPRYEILGLIGKGGMGDVYKARHRKMERTVALKVINRGLVQKAEAVDRFHREVKAAAQLSHPNIVTAHDADQAGDFHFMVMEYVDGVDLSQTVKDRGAMPVAEACDYIRQAAIGLQHAHECGMVHRDIKPHNLMVTSDGTVKILDFGLASLAPKAIADADTVEARGDLTAAGAIMGTPDFISPEQANDARKADIRGDIYSLGATLYFLLSGRPPFAGGSVMHKLKSHAQSDPEPLDTLRLDVPADLAVVITRMMEKDPDERFQTPEELAEKLKPFSRSAEPREIVEPPTQAEPHRWMSTFLSLAAVAVLLFAAIFAGLGYFGVRFEAKPPEDTTTLGTHRLTIVDTSGKKPYGGTSGGHQNDATGITTHTYESANGRYKITLVNDVLTVNGDKYTLENPTDSIRIVDERVEITREAGLGTKKVDPTDRGEPAVATPASDGAAAAGDPGTSPNGKPVSECAAIQAALRKYYMDKYPLSAASMNHRSNILSDTSKLRDRDWLRQIDKFGTDSPVSEVINSFPGKPYVTFTEVTEASRNEVLVVCVNLYRNADETCRVEVTKKQRKKRAGEPVAVGKPITEEEVHKLVRRVAKDSDFKQLQGDWESVSVTEGGKQLSTEDGFGGLLLQIKGNTFVIAERKPDGEKSEVDTGRIEINSTTYPKTIDFIGRAQSTFGIYEFKHGVLRVCLVEQGGTDAPAEERIPNTKAAKRPTTFDSPAGSNMMQMEFQRKQPDVNTEQQTRNLLDTTYISNDTVAVLVAHPQRILSRKSKVKEDLDHWFADVAESEGLDVRNVSQVVAQLGPPPLSSRPIRNVFDEQLWTVILRFDEPVDVESYIETHAQGYEKAEHKHETYYRHGNRMQMWFPDNRTLILAAERRILSLIDDPEGKGPMALRMRRADPTADLLLEIDVRQAGPLLLESLPSEAQTPEVYSAIEQTLQKLKRITLTAQQSSDTPIQARFHAVDAEQANELHAQAVVWLETAKTRWPKLRDLIRERPADQATTPPNRRVLALAFADEIDFVLPSLRSTVDEDQLLVRLEQEGGVDLATLLTFLLLID